MPGVSSRRPAAGQLDQLAGRSRVPAAPVVADLGDRLHVLTAKTVDERRLPHSGGAEQSNRAIAREIRTELVDALAGQPAGDVDGNADRHSRHRGQCRLHVVAEVSLGEHDDRLRARVPNGRQIALEPPGVEIAVEAGDQEDDIDVRAEHLLLDGEPRGLPRDRGPARQDSVDDRSGSVVVRADDDPVAGHGQAAVSRLVVEPSGRLRGQIACLGADDIGATMLDRDACGQEAVTRVRGERLFEMCAPAERFQRWLRTSGDLLGRRMRGSRVHGPRRGASPMV